MNIYHSISNNMINMTKVNNMIDKNITDIINYKKVIIPKKLGKIFKNDELPVDERVLLVKSLGGIIYIYYKYSIDPTLHDKTRIAAVTKICETNEDGTDCIHPKFINPHCIESGISCLLKQCNYGEVRLPVRYSNVCGITEFHHEFMFTHISFY